MESMESSSCWKRLQLHPERIEKASVVATSLKPTKELTLPTRELELKDSTKASSTRLLKRMRLLLKAMKSNCWNSKLTIEWTMKQSSTKYLSELTRLLQRKQSLEESLKASCRRLMFVEELKAFSSTRRLTRLTKMMKLHLLLLDCRRKGCESTMGSR